VILGVPVKSSMRQITRRQALALIAATPQFTAAAKPKSAYPFEYWEVFTDRPFTLNLQSPRRLH